MQLNKFSLDSINTTKVIAQSVYKLSKKGDIFALYGDIGVGKTTFIRYLVNNLQKKNLLKLTEVPSPTFNLLNEYELNNLSIQHYDLFRLKNINETKNIGLLENYSNFLTLIEWQEKIKTKEQEQYLKELAVRRPTQFANR